MIMHTLFFISVEDSKKTLWCIADSFKLFKDFTQYTVKNLKGLEDFIIFDTVNNKSYPLMKVAKNLGLI